MAASSSCSTTRAPPTAATRSSGWCSAAARSTTTSTSTTSARARESRDRPGRAPLPVRPGADHAADRQLPEPQGDRLGPGGAAEHGRLEGDLAPHARAVPDGVEFRYVGRPQRASPSEGYPPPTAPSRSESCSPRSRASADACLGVDAALRKPVPGRALRLGQDRSPRSSWGCSPRCSSSGSLPGFEGETFVFGLGHGVGFLALCLLIWIAVLRREAPYWFLAATLTPVGPVGSVIGINVLERREARRAPRPRPR